MASFKTPWMCAENKNIKLLVGSSYMPTADSYNGMAQTFAQAENSRPEEAAHMWANARQSGMLTPEASRYDKASDYYRFMADRTAVAHQRLESADMAAWCSCAASRLDGKLTDADFPAKGDAGYLHLKQAVEDTTVDCLN